jgi:hypothetical protein
LSIFGIWNENRRFLDNMTVLERSRPVQFRLVLRRFEENGAPSIRKVRSGNHEWIRGREYAFPERKNYVPMGGADSPWLLLALGYGLGAGVAELPRKYAQARRIVVFEPDIDIFILAMAESDQKEILLDGRFSFVLGKVPVEVTMQFREAMPLSTLALAGALGVVAHEGAFEAFAEEYAETIKSAKQAIDMFFKNLGNSVEDTLLGIKQFAVNTANIAISSPLESLKDAAVGNPGIVVSAGPSLDKNIDVLLDAQRKVPIVCNDVVLPKLLERGIVPDIVCALERGYMVYEHWFSKVRDKTRDIILVAPAVVSPEIFGTFLGPKFVVVKKGLPLDERFADLFNMDKMHTGSSVAHMCFNIAHLLGCDPIILIGQDLAYGTDGLTHSTDVTGTTTQEVASMYKDNVNITEIPGSLGGVVKTNHWWLMFLRQLEALVANCRAEVIDATEGGALIHGTSVRPLKDVLDQYLPESTFSSIKDRLSPPTVLMARNRLERLASRVRELEDNMKDSYRLFDEVESHVEQALAPGLGENRRRSLAEFVGQALDELQKRYPDIFQLVQSYVFSMFVDFTKMNFDFSDPEFRERWGRLNREFVATSRVAVRYLLEYVSWMRRTAETCEKALLGEEKDPALYRALEYKRDWTTPRSEIPLEDLWRALMRSFDEEDRTYFEEPRHLSPDWWKRVEDGERLHVIGKAFLRWRQYELAVQVLQKAAEKIPDIPDVWIDLGVAYGDYDVLRDLEIQKSMESFYTALSIDPANVRARGALEVLARRVVDLYESALESKESLGIGDSMKLAMYLNIADCYGVLRRFDKAVGYYGRVFEKSDADNRNDPERLVNYVMCLEQSGDIDGASRWAERLHGTLFAGNKAYPYAIWNLLSFYARNARWEPYVALLERMSTLPPLRELAVRHRAMVEEDVGNIGPQDVGIDGR